MEDCYRQSAYVPPNFICWNLTPKAMIYGDGAFERWLGYEDKALFYQDLVSL